MSEIKKSIINTFERYFKFHDDETSPEHYKVLKKNMIAVMLFITVVPLSIMGGIDFYQSRAKEKIDIETSVHLLADKTRHSVEMYLEKKMSIVRFVTNGFTLEDLKNNTKLNKMLWVLKKEFKSFVDLGLIDPSGEMIAYAGPYEFLGKKFSDNPDYINVLMKEIYISNIFAGYDKSPQIEILVARPEEDGTYVLRVTMMITNMEGILAGADVAEEDDIFLVSSKGVMQTKSNYSGTYFEKCKLDIPFIAKDTRITNADGPDDQKYLVAASGIHNFDYFLIIVRPVNAAFKAWNMLRTQIIMMHLITVFIVIMAVYKICGILVNRIKAADEKRERAFRDLQHNHKLSSIGRLAAGIAHEINNPLAIINEKAGLMKDLVEYSGDFQHRDKFDRLTASIATSVDRCRVITHRLLGFARRIDVLVEPMNVNNVVTEVLGFLENEALYRKIDIRLELSEDIKDVLSDRGQLQQVFLNILTNSFSAVEEGGFISVSTRPIEKGGVEVLFEDNGCGMTENVLKHIFEPFFSTKKGYGTGLGLSITFGIVKKLGGDIQVKSVEGQGTIFKVLLPESSENPLEEL